MEFKDPSCSLLLAEDSIDPQTKCISAIEALPTEILQQIAEYLIDITYETIAPTPPLTYTYECMYSTGICQLRASSKILRANSERAFVHCLRFKHVQFDGTGLSRLVELSLSDKYSSWVQTVVFHPTRKSRTDATATMTPLEAGGDKMARFRYYITEYAPETTFMIFALARLKSLHSVIVGPDFQRLYPSSVRQRSLAKHPPSMILAATIASKAPIRHMLTWDKAPELFHGVKPRIMDNLRYHAGCFKNLTSLSLMLTSRNAGAKSGDGLYRFLKHATNVQSLFLALDKASVAGIAPSSSSPSVLLWSKLSTLQFGKLRSFALRGWDLNERDLSLFLFAHNATLVALSFERCNLNGSWRTIISHLYHFHIMRCLLLWNISEGLYLLYPSIGRAFVSIVASTDPDLEDWFLIDIDPFKSVIYSEDHWKHSVQSVVDKMMRSTVQVRARV